MRRVLVVCASLFFGSVACVTSGEKAPSRNDLVRAMLVSKMSPGSARDGASDEDSKDMRRFVQEVRRAADDTGLQMPDVWALSLKESEDITSSPLVMAFVYKAEEVSNKPAIFIVSWALHSRQRHFRCIARHEVGHIALGQTALSTKEESAKNHALLAEWLMLKWKQEMSCDN